MAGAVGLAAGGGGSWAGGWGSGSPAVDGDGGGPRGGRHGCFYDSLKGINAGIPCSTNTSVRLNI